MSVTAAIALDYYFLPPIGTFTITDPHNSVALVTFLVTAIAVSELSARARREARSAVERRRELERLYAFSQLLLSNDSPAELLNMIPRYVVDSFGIRSAAISLSSRSDIYRSGPTIDGLEARDLQMVCVRGEPRSDAAQQIGFMPLRMGMRVVGCLGVSGTALRGRPWRPSGAWSPSPSSAPEPSKNSAAPRPPAKAKQLRSVLLDSVTHEFRSPLTAIKASVTSLLGGTTIRPRRSRNC